MSLSLDIDPLDLVDPTRFALHGYPHEVWTRLRAEAPVAYIEPPGYPPFWAVTKYADVQYAASQPQLFSSASGITLDMDLSGIDMPAEMIVYLDPPQHGPMRQVANKKFLRSAVRARSRARSSASPPMWSTRLRPGARSGSATSSTPSPLPIRWP